MTGLPGSSLPGRALSLRQPWATLCVIGAKQIETRDKRTSHRGPLAIQAAITFEEDERRAANLPVIAHALRAAGYEPDELPLGVIVGTVVVMDCKPVEELSPRKAERAFGNYDAGRYGWLLQWPNEWPEGLPCLGMPGIFPTHRGIERAAAKAAKR